MSVVNANLQREILERESEMASMNCDLEIDKASKVLMKTISEKDQIIHDFQQIIHTLNSKNEELSEKLCVSEMANSKYLCMINERDDTIHSLEEKLECQSTKNIALSSHVDGLNSFIVNSRRLNESLEALNSIDDDLRNNNNNNPLEKAIGTFNTETSPYHHIPVVKKRSFSIDIQGSVPIYHERKRNFYRSTTYKESDRFLSIADEMLASGTILKKDPKENENDDSQLSIFFDSLLEERRESLFNVKIKSNTLLEQVREDDSNSEISPACSKLLSELKKENESLRQVNETLALAQLSTKRPKHGFKMCIIS